VGCFGGHAVPKASLQPGEHEETTCEGSGRERPGDGACGYSRVAGESQDLL